MSGKRAGYLIILFLLGILVPLSGWDISSTYTVNWETGMVYIRVTASPETGDPSLPAARMAAEKAVEKALPLICLDTASELQADSRDTVGTIINSDRKALSAVRDLYRYAERSSSSFTDSFDSLTVDYRLKLFPDLIAPFIHHDRPYKMERRPDWEPTGPFTGILIYAQGELPEHGKQSSARLQPCLLPEVYDQEMKLLIAPYMINPESILSIGPVEYSYSLDERSVRDRIGYYPMRIAARGIFGTTPTDPIIPLEWADKIRSSRDLQQLIADGKIVIIIDQPGISPQSSAGP